MRRPKLSNQGRAYRNAIRAQLILMGIKPGKAARESLRRALNYDAGLKARHWPINARHVR